MTSPRRLRTYYGTRNSRNRIEKMLNEHGIMNIQQIHQRYNLTWSSGISMSELAAILSGDPHFEKVGTEQIRSITGKKYPSTIWGVVT